jgi:hypothetical protein
MQDRADAAPELLGDRGGPDPLLLGDLLLGVTQQGQTQHANPSFVEPGEHLVPADQEGVDGGRALPHEPRPAVVAWPADGLDRLACRPPARAVLEQRGPRGVVHGDLAAAHAAAGVDQGQQAQPHQEGSGEGLRQGRAGALVLVADRRLERLGDRHPRAHLTQRLAEPVLQPRAVWGPSRADEVADDRVERAAHASA